MNLNPQYADIGELNKSWEMWNFLIIYGIILMVEKFYLQGKGFVAQYYALFDDINQRNTLVNMYNVSIAKSPMNFVNFQNILDLSYSQLTSE